jgi:hypothetical protein
MGHFQTSSQTMQSAVNAIATTKAVVDRQIAAVGVTAAGTSGAWRGSGGETLRALVARYDESARKLQTAIGVFEELLAGQAVEYGITDADASQILTSAGGGLRM